MKIKQQTKTKGFTIIEVVLVLAIAGLIFMMVFFALPALQKSQRDTQRKNDLSRIMTQITNYSTTNRGAIPTSLTIAGVGAKSFVQNYLGGGASSTEAGDDYLDPTSGTGYVFIESNATSFDVGNIMYSGAKYLCGTDGAFTGATATARQFAIAIKLESQEAPYCLDNR